MRPCLRKDEETSDVMRCGWKEKRSEDNGADFFVLVFFPERQMEGRRGKKKKKRA